MEGVNMEKVTQYLKNRLAEKTTKAAITAAVVGVIADLTGASAEYIGPIEQIVGGVILLAIAALPSPNMDKTKANATIGAAMCALLLLSLTACAGALPWNKQINAGLTDWEIKNCMADDGTTYVCKARFIDGKESEEKQLAIQLSDGTIIKYSTGGERAFAAFQTRADVEKYVAEQFGEISPGIVDAIAKAAGVQ